MATHHLDVPALPVLVPLGVLLMIVSAWFLRRRGLLTPGRLAVAWLAGWYAVAVIGATMLPMRLSWGPGAGDPDLYRILWVPIVDMRRRDFVLNTMMTLPLGALLYMIFGVRRVRQVVGIGFLISFTIELSQLVLLLTLNGQRWADVHDVLSNTLGAWLGFLAFRWVMRSARWSRVVESYSFARNARGTPAVAR